MTDHSMPALPEPDVVSLPDDPSEFTNEAPYIWAFFAHGYDTKMNPYFSADTLHAYAQPLLERIKALEVDAARTLSQLEIGRAIERACKELPYESDGIEIRLERDSGTVYYLKNGLWKHIDDGDTFGEQINKAIDAAISTKEKP